MTAPDERIPTAAKVVDCMLSSLYLGTGVWLFLPPTWLGMGLFCSLLGFVGFVLLGCVEWAERS